FSKTTPAGGAANQAPSLTLAWGTSANATRYEYCLDTVNNDACDAPWFTTSDVSVALSGLAPLTTYWWQVRARNSAGTTNAADGWPSFTTAPTRQAWTPLARNAGFNASTCLLLTDGSVMCHEYRANRWHRLSPDAFGSYVNGTWSNIATMPDGV